MALVEGKVSSLPKLVVEADFDKVVRFAASGDLERLKAAIDSSLTRSQAKLHTHGEVKDDPPSITLSMPVVQATWGGHTPVVSYFVANFSDVVQNEDEESLPPYMYFLLDGSLLCCEESGSPTHRHGPYMASHIAASIGCVDILRLWGNSCVGWRDDLGRTPLHWAAFYDQNEAVQYLLSVGALASATSDRGVTPLLDCVIGLKSGCEVRFEVFMNLLRSGGEVEHSYASDIIEIFQHTSADEKTALLTIFLQAKDEETMVLLGKLFQLVNIAGHDRSVAKDDLNPVRSFIDGLRFLSFFCEDLSWLKAIWERIFQLGSEHNITVSYLPPIQVYEGQTEVTSWKKADLMLSRASSDPSEVIYQCGIMLESVLGYDSPYLIETLCNAPATLTLGLDHPSKALVHLFSRGIKLLNQYLNLNKPFFDLASPVSYFDDLVKSGHTLNFALPIQLLLDTLVLLQDQIKQLIIPKEYYFPSNDQEKMEESKEYPTFIAFDLLCRMAYIAHKKDGSSSRMLPHQIDEFGQRLLQLSPNIDIYYRIGSAIPSWIEDDDEQDYDEFVSECFKSWVQFSGALYALDWFGKLAIDHLIDTTFRYRYEFYRGEFVYSSVHQDIVLEYGTHPDAVNSSDRTPFESLQLLEGSDGYGYVKAAVKDAITRPPVPPLECLTARALVRYQFPYQTVAASDYLPHHLLQFISIHDPKRSKNIFTHAFLNN